MLKNSQKASNQQIQENNGDGRSIIEVVNAMGTSDGAGVRLKRSLGSPALSELDPFLLLDEFKSDQPDHYIAGFPDHPHRGFETVTYMLAGSMLHQDSVGNSGNLKAGSIQWMTAGRGIVHSEMPQQVDGLLWGFQLWVNLPADQKMCAPKYQDIEPETVPVVDNGFGLIIRVLAGSASGVTGPVKGIAVNPLFLDITMPANATFTREIEPGHSGFVYVFQGNGQFGKKATVVETAQLGVLDKVGRDLKIKTEDQAVRFLLLAGQPLGEPIARGGPFVMNTKAQVLQAFEDFRSGRFIQNS